MLKGKNILLGVTGSIAAYKAAMLIRLLIKEGAAVKVLMTPLAKEFISPLTLATLSKNPILVDFFNPENGDWNSHVDLGLWADAYVIAPATANTMGKMANGIADNLLLTTWLSARCPVFIAPAMDLDMFLHRANQKNLQLLTDFGCHIIAPSSGELASGLEGKGRMQEPEFIVNELKSFFQSKQNSAGIQHKFTGKNLLITAGPTFEPIDPVRFIGNYSSGKMGYALAQAFADAGAQVSLISGPSTEIVAHENIHLIRVTTAGEMYDAVKRAFPTCDLAILNAAVADFTPVAPLASKLKRKGDNLTIELKPTQDIAAELGRHKRTSQIIIGFALETDNEIHNAQKKLIAKNLDAIILNSLNDPGAGFNTDTNKISIIDKNNNIFNSELKEKKMVAMDILDYTHKHFFQP